MNCKALSLSILVPFLLSVHVSAAAAVMHGTVIREYRNFSAELYTRKKKFTRVALRKFRIRGNEYYLAVDPVALRMEIAPVGKYLILKKTFDDIAVRRKDAAYFKVLRFAGENSWRLQNAGITHIPGDDRTVYFTADLCPTGLPLDRVLITRLVREYGTYRRPVPAAIAVSGTWIQRHPEDLKWLKGLVQNGDLLVTWINHTYTHRHKKRVPLWKNFLLDINSRLEEEVMKNEILMMESGLIPSIFFRFPGLVSNKALFEGVTGLGLVPLGSNAWLGKKQWPVAGSIILVHANSQEPVGIRRFLWILGKWHKDIEGGRRVFGDLKDGLRKAMKMY